MRLTAYESSRLYKERVKTYHDKKLLKKDFQPGQQVLLSNSVVKATHASPRKLVSQSYVSFRSLISLGLGFRV